MATLTVVYIYCSVFAPVPSPALATQVEGEVDKLFSNFLYDFKTIDGQGGVGISTSSS